MQLLKQEWIKKQFKNAVLEGKKLEKGLYENM